MTHSISKEAGYFWWYILKCLKLIDRIQWIRGSPCCDEFVPLWFTIFDIIIGHTVVYFVERDMEQSWPRTLDVEIVQTKFWFVHFILCPDAWLGAIYIINPHIA